MPTLLKFEFKLVASLHFDNIKHIIVIKINQALFQA